MLLASGCECLIEVGFDMEEECCMWTVKITIKKFIHLFYLFTNTVYRTKVSDLISIIKLIPVSVSKGQINNTFNDTFMIILIKFISLCSSYLRWWAQKSIAKGVYLRELKMKKKTIVYYQICQHLVFKLSG